MAGYGWFFGGKKRNQPIELDNPHPVENYGTSSLESGDAGKDGFTILSRANPKAQGNPPPVKGTKGPVFWHNDFEQ